VRVALSDVAFAMVGNLGKIAEAQLLRRERLKDGNYLYGAFGRDFLTRDGRRIMIVALTLRQWRSLVAATGLGEAIETLEHTLELDLDKEGDRFLAREVIGAVLKPWTVARNMDEIGEVFDRHGVCWGPYQTFVQLADQDPRCSTANPMFEEVEQPGIGTYLMPGSPLDFGAFERLPVRPAPRLGEHTDEILGDLLGMSDTEIGRLHDRGVVAGPARTSPAAH
jgi:2-methylfumaryl-CoA isomerase